MKSVIPLKINLKRILNLRNSKFISTNIVCCLLIFLLSVHDAKAEDTDEYQKVTIAEAFIEFHTGPGRGYPVFHVVEKGQQISLIKKKTQWFKVRTIKGLEGWVHEDKMEQTLYGDTNFDAGSAKQKDFTKRSFEAGVLGGDFGGATALTLYGGWNFTENLTAELSVKQALGNVSEIRIANVSIVHQVFPEWRISPFYRIGAGVIQTEPFTTLVQTQDRTDQILNVGAGVKIYVFRKFFIRAEYVRHTILTSRNDNDEVNEWKLGFSVFF